MLIFDEDVESDLHRFHGFWIDIDQEQFGGYSAERLIGLIERLPAYDGAVAARLYHLQEEIKKSNPSADVLAQSGTTHRDLSSAMADPDLARDVEYEQV